MVTDAPHLVEQTTWSNYLSAFPGDVHRNPDGASPSAAVADGGSSDLSSPGAGPRGAHPLPSPLLQDPQQGAASVGVPTRPARQSAAAGPGGAEQKQRRGC